MLARNQIRRDSGRIRTPQPRWENVVFLCSWDGTDAATTATDDSSLGLTISFQSDAQLDTAQKRIGPSSLLLDGTGDACDVPNNSAYHLGAGDFTLETYVRFNNASTEAALMFIYTSASNQRAYGIEHYPAGGNTLFFYWSTTGANSFNVQRPWNPVANRWYHVAICRRGNLLYMFLGGKLIEKAEPFTSTIFNSGLRGMHFGEIQSNIINLNGWLDETRVTVGEGIYVKDFVPPQSAFPRQ